MSISSPEFLRLFVGWSLTFLCTKCVPTITFQETGCEVVMSVCQHGDDLICGKEDRTAISLYGREKCPGNYYSSNYSKMRGRIYRSI